MNWILTADGLRWEIRVKDRKTGPFTVTVLNLIWTDINRLSEVISRQDEYETGGYIAEIAIERGWEGKEITLERMESHEQALKSLGKQVLKELSWLHERGHIFAVVDVSKKSGQLPSKIMHTATLFDLYSASSAAPRAYWDPTHCRL